MYVDERQKKALARIRKLKAIRSTLTNFQERCYKELNKCVFVDSYDEKTTYLQTMIDKATEACFLATQESVKTQREFGWL